VFEGGHRFRGGTFGRRAPQGRPGAGARELERLLEAGCGRAGTKAAAPRESLVAWPPAAGRFAATPGGEPTNNPAARLPRRAVLGRKGAFGCPGAGGCRFVERIGTAAQTLRPRGRPVRPYLRDVLVAHRNGLQAPSLLPVG